MLQVELLEMRDCPSCTLPGSMQSVIDNPSSVIQHNAGAIAGNNQPGNATEQAWVAANLSPDGQQPLFYMVINGVSTPQYDYSNMDLTNALNFAAFLDNPQITQALTPVINNQPVVGVVNNYDPAPVSTDFPSAATTVPTNFSATLPSSPSPSSTSSTFDPSSVASVAEFLVGPNHNG